ncbi:hypothetical protein Metli_0275 [Methanofollis liminatans DSM 4140]|uniref:Methyltransferase n=1 Tax=Methanofollis liminatans DSM 4140 TaxID=28892 RepID=J1KZR8_9EURY|nr:hypothetical protein [Methanofollis liminatans]EJG06247.1 hypothetical protein Metli_0275 [Methanofollis liminatans DSM 4140]
MHCPVCGRDHIGEAGPLLASLPDVFAPCDACRGTNLDKAAPLPPGFEPRGPCACGRQFIDDVFAAIYLILLDEGTLAGTEPLRAAGVPVTNPGFAMAAPPHLPEDSLVLLSPHPDRAAAERIVEEVPAVQGVVRTVPATPGIGPDGGAAAHALLAGCDVQANVFSTSYGDIVVYKELSRMHIEFPRPFNPKIRSVEREIDRHAPRLFIDACCGAGTLGLAAALAGTPVVVFNDAYGPAAFWTAFNIAVNRDALLVASVSLPPRDLPVSRSDPVVVAGAEGDQRLIVCQGDFTRLPPLVPGIDRSLAALDLFGKEDRAACDAALAQWRKSGGGKAFIP